MKTTVLIVEDEREIRSFLEPELRHEGYGTATAVNGEQALERFRAGGIDLVLLDILLPGISGIEVLRRIRRQSDVPVIMLTARNATYDKVSALDQGADDYLVKPFEIEELLARMRAALRKRKQKLRPMTFEDIALDPDARSVKVSGEEVELSAKEFDLLRLLMENQGVVLSRDRIVDRIWGADYVGDQKVVDVYVRHLRTKLDDPFGRTYITTVRGVGYTMKRQSGYEDS
ncbi:MAG: response regulator transcription factor [Clostridia bacterium]|nr:response regulator transcription factor [Clostridia bacterium]